MGCADIAIAPTDKSALSGSISSSDSYLAPALSAGGYTSLDSKTEQSAGNCQATSTWRQKFAFADQWCQTQCPTGNCPLQYCNDSCRRRRES